MHRQEPVSKYTDIDGKYMLISHEQINLQMTGVYVCIHIYMYRERERERDDTTSTHTNLLHTYVRIHTYIHIYIYVCVCVPVCYFTYLIICIHKLQHVAIYMSMQCYG